MLKLLKSYTKRHKVKVKEILGALGSCDRKTQRVSKEEMF